MIIRVKHETPVDVMFVDTETTGLNTRTDHILELAWIKIRHGEDPLDLQVLNSDYAKLSLWTTKFGFMPWIVTVPKEAAAINGFNPEDWEGGKSRRKVFDWFWYNQKDACFGGQNPRYDFEMITTEFMRQGKQWPKLQYHSLFSVDAMARPLMLLGYVKRVSQKELMEFFKLGEQRHDAWNDVKNAIAIYHKLLCLSVQGLTPEAVQDVVDQPAMKVVG